MATVDIKVPDLGVEKAIVNEIMVNIGDRIHENDSIVLVESDKATVEIPSPQAGIVQQININVGDVVKEGVLLLQLQTEQSIANIQTEIKPQPSTSPSSILNTLPIHAIQVKDNTNQHTEPLAYAGPAVRKLARQLGVTLQAIQGSAINHRIIKEDVFDYVAQQLNAKNPQQMATVQRKPLSDYQQFGAGEYRPLSRLQQAAISHLKQNQFILQVTQFDQADITELEAWRKTLIAKNDDSSVKITVLAFVVKAVAHLLQQEALFRSHLGDDEQSIYIRHAIHIGIAVATEECLIVPVLRQPEQKSVTQIAQEVAQLSQKARHKTLHPKDLQGANFTISNLGGVGGIAFTPLVNAPQVAILGLSPTQNQAVWNGTTFLPRLMLPLSLSYDHRVINGIDAARFTTKLAHLLMDIRQILL